MAAGMVVQLNLHKDKDAPAHQMFVSALHKRHSITILKKK